MSGFAYEQHKGYSVVRFESNLPEMSWSDVEKEAGTVVSRMKEADVSRLLIDLSPMEMIQSGLIASLVRMWKATEGKKDRRVVLATPNDVVKDVIKSAGLLKLFTVVETREEGAYELGVSKGAQLEQRERRVVAWVAFPAAILALLAMVPLVVGTTDTVKDNAKYATSVLAAFSALTSVFSLAKDKGWRRALGGVALLLSLGILSVVYVNHAGGLDVVRDTFGLGDDDAAAAGEGEEGEADPANDDNDRKGRTGSTDDDGESSPAPASAAPLNTTVTPVNPINPNTPVTPAPNTPADATTDPQE